MKNAGSSGSKQFNGVLFTAKGKKTLFKPKRRWYRNVLSAFAVIPFALKSLFSRGLSFRRKSSGTLNPSKAYQYAVKPESKMPFYYWLRINLVALILALCMITQFIIESPLVTPVFKDITINDNGAKRTVRTNARTIGELIEEKEVVLDSGDIIALPDNVPLYAGIEVPISRSKTVTLRTMNGPQTVAVNAGTVADVLRMAGIEWHDGDIVTPSLNTLIAEGMLIDFTSRNSEYIFIEVDLPYGEVLQKDYDLPKGEKKVAREGQMGVRRDTYLVSFMNGEETSRDKVDAKVVQEPVNKIISVGQYVKPTPTPKPAQPSASPKPTKKPSSNIPAVAGLDMSRVDKTMKVTTTAYTHTGRKTATGKWPKRGTIAINRSDFKFGTKFYIPGYGYGVADDTGVGPGKIDLFMDSERECRKWGRRKITIYILKN